MSKNIIGLKNEFIEIIEDLGIRNFPYPHSKRRKIVKIKCVCKEEKVIQYDNFKKTKSCGCKNKVKLPIGEKFGRLIVTKDLGRGILEGSKTEERNVECICECGNIVKAQWMNIKHGRIKSCGCLQSETSREKAKRMQESNIKHGDSIKNSTYFRLYNTWNMIRARCYNKKHDKYKWYGAKGIRICEEWHDYTVFKEWAIENGYQNDLTIDRIDVLGDYEPNNCQWITAQENIEKEYTIDKLRKERVKNK